jgi:hypothetical protein
MTYFSSETNGLEIVLGRLVKYCLHTLNSDYIFFVFLAATINKLHPAVFTAPICDGLQRVLAEEKDVRFVRLVGGGKIVFGAGVRN